MTHNYELYRRARRFRASALATLLALPFAACNNDELTNTTAEDVTNPAELAEPVTTVEVETPSFSSSFRGGIPIGTYAQPTSAFGDRLNGALRNIWPKELLKELAAIKARGGKIVVMFAGYEGHYKTNGYFDLRKWKARIDRYKGVDFSSYVRDGTVIAHYLIDEPNDPANWRRKPVTPSMLEEMARYSKQRWPTLPTVVRVDPSYLGSKHRYLDAAWAQYLHRRGPADDYLRRVVADAQKRGLGLVVGMNIKHGGRNKRPMSASQVKEWGSTLLSGSYPCAFISWTYDKKYVSRSDIAGAMSYLAGKARSKSARSCRGGGGGGGGGGDDDDGRGGGGGDDDDGKGKGKGGGGGGSARGGSGGNSGAPLRASGRESRGRQFVTLTWSGVKGKRVNIYRNGNKIDNTKNDRRYVDDRTRKNGRYHYKVCRAKTRQCTKTVRVVFR